MNVPAEYARLIAGRPRICAVRVPLSAWRYVVRLVNGPNWAGILR